VTLQSGPNLIEARARDGAGQWGPIVSVTVNGAADLKPVGLFSTPAPDATVAAAEVAVNGIASDDQGVDEVTVRVSSGEWCDAAGTSIWGAVADVTPGTTVLQTRALSATPYVLGGGPALRRVRKLPKAASRRAARPNA